MALLSALSSQPAGLIRPYQSKLQSIALFVDLSLIFWGLYFSAVYWEIELDRVHAFGVGLAVAAYLVFADMLQVYGLWRGTSKRIEALKILGAWALTLSVLAIAGFIFDVSGQYSRKIVATWGLLTPFSIIILHIAKRKVLTFARRRGRNSRSYAVIGASELGVSLHQKLTKMDWLGYEFKGFFDEGGEIGEQKTRSIEKLIEEVKASEIDLVYIALPLAAEDRIRVILNELADSTASVFIVPDFTIFDPVRARWNSVQGIPLVSVYDTPFGEFESFIKRAFDIVLSSLILLAIAVPMLVIAGIIKYTSPGPVLFKQKRYGIDGDEIKVWKFRSMSVTEDGSKVTQATKNDTRITPFGAFIRRTSLDELPQFINVLQGRMSIIGPRPHAVAHNEYYRTKVRGYMLRHKVKPGITGLAQVKGFRGETDTDEKMMMRAKYDLQYINNWSLLLDIKIFIGTFYSGFVNKNAY